MHVWWLRKIKWNVERTPKTRERVLQFFPLKEILFSNFLLNRITSTNIASSLKLPFLISCFRFCCFSIVFSPLAQLYFLRISFYGLGFQLTSNDKSSLSSSSGVSKTCESSICTSLALKYRSHCGSIPSLMETLNDKQRAQSF